jgi:hypothetical protein
MGRRYRRDGLRGLAWSVSTSPILGGLTTAGADDPFAQFINRVRKHVGSSTLSCDLTHPVVGVG